MSGVCIANSRNHQCRSIRGNWRLTGGFFAVAGEKTALVWFLPAGGEFTEPANDWFCPAGGIIQGWHANCVPIRETV